jgi:hypothetical protein
MYSSGGDNGASEQEAQTQQQLTQGTNEVNQQFAQFTPSFYQQAAQAYTNYATPQVLQQYQQTGNTLTGNLARNGILNSSATSQLRGSLGNELNTNLSNVANTAQDQANQLQSNVQSQKNQLLQQVEAGASPSEIATQAQSATAGLRAPTPLPAVGNMFSDWSNTYLANMEANTYNPNTGNLFQLLGGYGGYSPSSAVIN